METVTTQNIVSLIDKLIEELEQKQVILKRMIQTGYQKNKMADNQDETTQTNENNEEDEN